MQNVMIISSDGHATALMDDYRYYIDPSIREEFLAFCEVYREKGTRVATRSGLVRLDGDVLDKWDAQYVQPGRLDGSWNLERRFRETESEGVCGEVLIPDFGLPFELYNPIVERAKNHPPRTHEQVVAGNRAYNRWLADFCSQAPERFAGMAAVNFVDVDDAIKEIRWVKKAGLKGVMIPKFDLAVPLFDPRFDPIWSVLEDLELPVNSHASISATTTQVFSVPSVPHPGCGIALGGVMVEFFTHQVLDHLIWGGVLERHPNLRVVFTEQGSGWIPAKLEAMDYSYSGSYLRRDIHEAIKHTPSEYFARQCWIGSSLLSLAEVENRKSIGIDKMMIGVDYPHHEGTWNGGTLNYLQATFGAAHVPLEEARKMLGETIATVYGFDVDKLVPVAERVGPTPERILTPPSEDKFPRGDVHKPVGAFL